MRFAREFLCVRNEEHKMQIEKNVQYWKTVRHSRTQSYLLATTKHSQLSLLSPLISFTRRLVLNIRNSWWITSFEQVFYWNTIIIRENVIDSQVSLYCKVLKRFLVDRQGMKQKKTLESKILQRNLARPGTSITVQVVRIKFNFLSHETHKKERW